MNNPILNSSDFSEFENLEEKHQYGVINDTVNLNEFSWMRFNKFTGSGEGCDGFYGEGQGLNGFFYKGSGSGSSDGSGDGFGSGIGCGETHAYGNSIIYGDG